MCDMAHSYVRHDSFIRVTWLIPMCVTWLIHLFDMTHSYVWHESFICVTWLIHMCDMTDSYVWPDSFIRVTWIIHMCDMTHSYVWYDWFICVTWLIHTCDMTHSSHHGGKVAKQKKFSSAYQSANIQIFCTGQGTSISVVHIWMWTMDSRILGGKYLKRLETRNNGWFDLTFSHFEWGPWRFCDAKSQRFGSKSNPD